MLHWIKLRSGENKESTMIKSNETPANIGEITFHDPGTGDFSLSMHVAIVQLTVENRRLQSMIDDLLNKIECLRCVPELQALGSA